MRDKIIGKDWPLNFAERHWDGMVNGSKFFKVSGASQEYKGLAKLRLVHFEWGSLVVPDIIVCEGRFFRPFSIDVCQLSKLAKDHVVTSIRCNLSYDVSVRVEFESTSLVETLPDYSQVFAVKIFGPQKREFFSSALGDANIQDTSVALKLFHHTNSKARDCIKAARQLWSSNWNLQGSEKVEDRSFAYLTSLPRISHVSDMVHIGMHPEEIIRFQLDQNRDVGRDNIIEVPVVKRELAALSETIKIWIDWKFITPSHFFFHSGELQPGGLANWHETVMPLIFRVPMEVNAPLDIGAHNNRISAIPRFAPLSYFVEGAAFERGGILAPLKENGAETRYLWKTDVRLPSGNLALAWFEQANSRVFDTL